MSLAIPRLNLGAVPGITLRRNYAVADPDQHYSPVGSPPPPDRRSAARDHVPASARRRG
jgi:hypothetical protein